jgi:hypothetical protein
MKKILPFCLSLLLLAALPFITHAQTVYEGQVIDNATELPIPYVTVKLLKAGIAMQTNEQGYFNITVSAPLPNDKLVFSFVGYKTKELATLAYQKQMFILLEASNTQLKEVTISARKKKTLEEFSYRDLIQDRVKLYASTATTFHTLSLFAKLFEAPRDGSKLISVQLGRRNELTGRALDGHSSPNKYTRFKVHVLSVNPGSGAPDSILFTKEVSLADNANKVIINLSADQLTLPPGKFFIAVEWIRIPYNEIIEDLVLALTTFPDKSHDVYQILGHYRIIYQPLLVGYLQYKPTESWIKTNGAWQRFEHPGYDIALSATIID